MLGRILEGEVPRSMFLSLETFRPSGMRVLSLGGECEPMLVVSKSQYTVFQIRMTLKREDPLLGRLCYNYSHISEGEIFIG